MTRLTPADLVHIKNSLEKNFADLIRKRQYTALQPFLLLDLRHGKLKSSFLHPTPSGYWEASSFHVKDVLVSERRQKADKSEFELALYHHKDRWMPASAQQMRELDQSSHKYVTGILHKLSDKIITLPAEDMLKSVFWSIARNDSEVFASVVVLVESFEQKRLIQSVLTQITNKWREDQINNLSAWQTPIVIALPNEPSDAFAIASHEQLADSVEREYLVIYSDMQATLFRWQNNDFTLQELTRQNKVDIARLSGIAFITGDMRQEKSNKVLMVADVDELRKHATIRFVLYYLYTYSQRTETVQDEIRKLTQEKLEIENEVAVLNDVYTRFHNLQFDTV